MHTAFAAALANPLFVVPCLLIAVVSLWKLWNLRFEPSHIPATKQEIRAFNTKKHFLTVAAFIFGILPLINFLLVWLSY